MPFHSVETKFKSKVLHQNPFRRLKRTEPKGTDVLPFLRPSKQGEEREEGTLDDYLSTVDATSEINDNRDPIVKF